MKAFWPFRNLGLKALAVGIGAVLWMTVSGEETVERGLRAPLELQQVPSGLEVPGNVPSTVDVRVRGTAGALGNLTASDIVAVLDLRGARAGNRVFTMTPDQVRSPYGIEVVQVTPSTIAMSLETTTSRDVAVAPLVEGTPAPGFVVVGKPVVTPDHVAIVGPETAVAGAADAVTETLSIAGARDSVRQDVAVGLHDPALRLKTQRTVTVSVKIVPSSSERVVRGVALRWRNLGPRLAAQVEPAAVDVVVRGTRESLNRVNGDGIVAYVDAAGLSEGEHTVAVQTETPDGAGAARVEPARVQVRISSVKN